MTLDDMMYLASGIILALLFIWAAPYRFRANGLHGRGFSSSRRHIHAGSPTNLRFTDDGKIVDKNGKELKPVPMKEWLEGHE